MPMTPQQHALQWWGDESYPKGQDWDALIAQFRKCRDEARVEAFDAVLNAAAAICDEEGADTAAARIRALRDLD